MMTEEKDEKIPFPYKKAIECMEKNVLAFPEVKEIGTEGMQELISGISQVFRGRWGNGLRILHSKTGRISVEISVVLYEGTPLMPVCRAIQESLVRCLSDMVPDPVEAVNITVTGIAARKEAL